MKWQSSQFAVEEPKLKTRYFFCPLFDDFKLILVDSFGAYSHFYISKLHYPAYHLVIGLLTHTLHNVKYN
jgi:hypothetical protein